MAFLNYCTVSATGSLLNSPIPSNTMPLAMLPLVNLLPAGVYDSEIIAVEDAIQNGDIVGIDCTHKLTDCGGKTLFVKFRFFDPVDTEALIQKLSAYGLRGSIGAALSGLQETVDIAPRPKSTRYMYIAHRVLAVNTTIATSAGSAPPPVNLAVKASPPPRSAPSCLGSKHSDSQRKVLISEDEDGDNDDFDDFLDESDE